MDGADSSTKLNLTIKTEDHINQNNVIALTIGTIGIFLIRFLLNQQGSS